MSRTFLRGCCRVCQVEGCGKALTGLRAYFKRVRIYPEHHAASVIFTDGITQRFCQKCGQLQPLEAFDGSRRSCAHKLQVHNQHLKRKRGAQVRLAKLIEIPAHYLNVFGAPYDCILWTVASA